MLWSWQLRTFPADLIHRPKPNPWTDGPAGVAHVDSHMRRVITEYIVDAARLEDCWQHSLQFQSLVRRWESHVFAEAPMDKEALLGHLTTDMRRFRHAKGNVEQDARFPKLPEEEITESDRNQSTFWSCFDPVPLRALNFWSNLTPSSDDTVARPLAFASPEMVVEVEDRSKGKPMRPHAAALAAPSGRLRPLLGRRTSQRRMPSMRPCSTSPSAPPPSSTHASLRTSLLPTTAMEPRVCRSRVAASPSL